MIDRVTSLVIDIR